MGSGEGSTMRNLIFSTVHLTVWVIKSGRFRCAGHIARMVESKNDLKVLTRKPIIMRPSELGGQY